MLIALFVRYPQTMRCAQEPVNLNRTLRMMSNPYALGFGSAVGLYVAVEASVYVWGPLYLATYHGHWPLLASYAIAIFFALRAAGRFIGAWLLSRLDWSAVLVLMAGAIVICLAASAWGGVRVAVVMLPLSGLFMAVIYPTLNSKGISCFRKAEHGAVAGVILFFTCLGAVLGPLAMGGVIDLLGAPQDAFVLATILAGLLVGGLTYNWLRKPTRALLARLDMEEYSPAV
jgi:fucose permease